LQTNTHHVVHGSAAQPQRAESAGRHVGVDATTWLLRRGFGRHTRSLLRAMVEVDRRNRYTFFVDSPDAVPLLPDGIGVRVVRVSSPTIVAASAHGRRSLRDLATMSRALSRSGLDAVLFPTLYSYVPTFGAARRFLILHDATAEMFPALALGGWKNRLFWRVKTALGRWQADVLITVSEYSRHAISARLGIATDRLHVVGEAPDPVFRVLDRPEMTSRLRSAGFDPSRRTIVYLGGFSPHKNVDSLVRVAERLAREPEFADVDVLLVGDNERDSFVSSHREIGRIIDSLGLASRVRFTGFIPDEDVVVLLNLATVLVLPSQTEGLGLPAVEAAACGCPVIATAESPLPGLLGDAARYIDPNDGASLERALMDVLRSGEVRRRMRERGIAAAARMSWHAAARRLLDLIDAATPP
jgi:glycosyltransferase involved in cell wall biosynthesis